MAGKRLTSEEIVARLRQVEVLSSQGKTVAEAVRAIGVTEVTYYRWRNEYGGLKGDQVKRLKELEAENTRLRRAISDLIREEEYGYPHRSTGADHPDSHKGTCTAARPFFRGPRLLVSLEPPLSKLPEPFR